MCVLSTFQKCILFISWNIFSWKDGLNEPRKKERGAAGEAWKRLCIHAKSCQSHPTLCNPMYCSLPGSPVHGILQAKRQLEGVVMPSPKGSSQPRNWTHVFCLLHWQVGSLPLMPPGKPKEGCTFHFYTVQNCFAFCMTFYCFMLLKNVNCGLPWWPSG